MCMLTVMSGLFVPQTLKYAEMVVAIARKCVADSSRSMSSVRALPVVVFGDGVTRC